MQLLPSTSRAVYGKLPESWGENLYQGSTYLAGCIAAERRAALWKRLVGGELTPWAYNLELLDGLSLPEGELDDFLESVDLDPGAPALLAWCQGRGLYRSQ